MFDITGNTYEVFDSVIISEVKQLKSRFSNVEGLKVVMDIDESRLSGSSSYKDKTVKHEFTPKCFEENDLGIMEGFKEFSSLIESMILSSDHGGAKSEKLAFKRRTM